MTDHRLAAHDAALAHLQECERALEQQLEGDSVVDWPADMAGPYDGCDVCQVREILHAAWPHMLAEAGL